MTAEKMVEKYILLRDKMNEIRKRHQAELEKYVAAIAMLEGMLLDVLNEHNAKTMKVETGTFYKTTRSSSKVTDWREALDFIRANEAWELLEARVSKTAAAAIIEETKQPIPGVEVTREVVVQVRRP
jgi:hypothetical protein